MIKPRTLRKQKKGFALVFAIFLTVGLQTVIAGNFLNVMRHQREVQRAADQNQLTWVAEAVIDRTVKLFTDYITTTDQFPNLDAANLVLGNDSDVVTGGKTFEDVLLNWYSGTSGFKSRFPDVLNRIEVLDVTITYMGPSSGKERYEIAAKVRHTTNQTVTTVKQDLLIANGHLFDFSVFYNNDLEIAAGPNFTLEGSIFSNKNVYLMTDNGNTLTLKRPAGFDSRRASDKFILQSAGNIYFYFKRALAKNYLLDNPEYQAALLNGGLPSYYKTNNSDFYPPADGAELYSFYYGQGSGKANVSLGEAHPYYPPFPYYFTNDADLGAVLGADANHIRVEDPNGSAIDSATGLHYTFLAPPRPKIDSWYSSYTLDSYYVPSGSSMSISTAFDPLHLPKLDPSWTAENPLSGNPLRNPIWEGVGSVVLDDQESRTIPIGDPNDPEGAHILIEPLKRPVGPEKPAGQVESDEIRKLKIESKADYDIACLRNNCSPASRNPIFSRLVLEGVIRTLPDGALPTDLYDYRIGGPNNCARVLEIDIGKLLALDEAKMNADSDGTVVYVLVNQSSFVKSTNGSVSCTANSGSLNLVKIVNGKQLPENGLTIATNGRLWVQGDYNTFDYNKNGYCTAEDWNNRTCKVPPAAFMSDSFGVLSNEWSNNYANSTVLDDRAVANDVMVNAAVVTGFVPSQLRKTYPSCNATMSNCLEYGPPSYGYQCPNGLNATTGEPVDSLNCEYKQNPTTKLYYINKASKSYQDAALISEAYLPSWEIPLIIDPETIPPRNNTVPASPPREIRNFVGVYQHALERGSIFPQTANSCGNYCPSGIVEECTTNPQGEQTSDCHDTCPGGWEEYPCSVQDAPHAWYSYAYRYSKLYETKYSGGLENLINFQERWADRTLRFSGVLTAPWNSKDLVIPTTVSGQTQNIPLYYGTTYYGAPIRDYRYNENFRSQPAPSTPSVFSIKRQSWSRS